MTRLLSLLPLFFLSLQGTHALWPQPSKLQTGTSALRLAPNTTFKITVDVVNAPADLLAAVQRTRAYLFTDNLARLVPSHGAEDLPALSHAETLPGLMLRLQATGEATGEGYGVVSREIALEARTYILDRQEGYMLDVPADGTEAMLSAASTLGLFRGLNTFAQLWYTIDYGKEALDQDGKYRDHGNGVAYTLSAPVAIQDSPAYVSPSFPFPFFRDADMGGSGYCSHIVGSCWTRHGTCGWLVAKLKLVITITILASQCLTLNERSMRCPGSMCESFCPLSRGACHLTGDDFVAQYVPLAYRRQPELPARRALFPGHCTKGRIQHRFSVHSAGRRTHRILRRRGAFSSFPLFHTISHLVPNHSQRGIDVLVVCVFAA